MSSPDLVGDARQTDFMEEQFTHVLDKGLLDCFLSGFDSAKNARAYLQEVDRVLRADGHFVYVTYAEPARRLALLQLPGWTVEVSRLYRTCAEEEAVNFEQELFGDEGAPATHFDKVLAENLTRPQLDRFRHKKHHFAYVCRKGRGS